LLPDRGGLLARIRPDRLDHAGLSRAADLLLDLLLPLPVRRDDGPRRRGETVWNDRAAPDRPRDRGAGRRRDIPRRFRLLPASVAADALLPADPVALPLARPVAHRRRLPLPRADRGAVRRDRSVVLGPLAQPDRRGDRFVLPDVPAVHPAGLLRDTDPCGVAARGGRLHEPLEPGGR